MMIHTVRIRTPRYESERGAASVFWPIHDGMIRTSRLEINVVHHCNLTCRGCSHMSPVAPRFFISPEKLFSDLRVLAGHCHTECVSLLGGEPLLHPQLLAVISAVRESGIGNRIRIVTNGLLLHSISESMWKSVDEIHVSLYPFTPMKIRDFATCRTHAQRNSVSLNIRYQDHFSEYFYETGNQDESLVSRIYRTCTTPREDSCHTLCEGIYYKCPQAVFIPMIHRNRPDLVTAQDGINIHGSRRLAEDLAEYLSASIPLAACRYCLGSVGKRFTPAQASDKPKSQPVPMRELIDWKRLDKLEKKKGMPIENWLLKASLEAKKLMIRLPPSILLSPLWRRALTVLGEMKRNYTK